MFFLLGFIPNSFNLYIVFFLSKRIPPSQIRLNCLLDFKYFLDNDYLGRQPTSINVSRVKSIKKMN